MLMMQRWLANNDRSPMTNKKLPHKAVTPNHTLRSAILEAKEEYHHRQRQQSVVAPAWLVSCQLQDETAAAVSSVDAIDGVLKQLAWRNGNSHIAARCHSTTANYKRRLCMQGLWNTDVGRV